MSSIFSNQAINYIKTEIQKANGNEVFFIGSKKNSKQINTISHIARGNKNEVPVIYDQAFKGDYVIHNHPSENLSPSHNDLSIASYLGNQGIGFIIVNNTADKSYVVVEGVDNSEISPINISELLSLFDEKGKIATHFNSFELREPQVKMLKIIAEAFNDNNIAIIEAGTGVGKSIAYLIPTIYWATTNNEKVIISTNTINLQEQLYNKDIPFLKKALDINFKAVVVKGRANYICLKKLYSSKNDMNNELFEPFEKTWIKSLISAIPNLKEGTKDELITITNMEGWYKIASESDTCLRTKCNFFSKCFFFIARKEVNQANILVVNHHILCSDIIIKNDAGDSYGLLPPYNKVIIDEAHNLEHVAINYLGKYTSQSKLKKAISRIYYLKGSAEKGILSHIKREIKTNWSNSGYEIVDELTNLFNNELTSSILSINPLIDSFFLFITDYTLKQLNNKQDTLRIIPDNLPGDFANNLNNLGGELVNIIINLNDKLVNIISKLYELPFHIREELLDNINTLKAYTNRLLLSAISLDTFINFKDNDTVYWIEVKKNHNTTVNLNVSPLNIADVLCDTFFSTKESIILTSATLTSNNSFHFLKQELGILNIDNSDRLVEIALPSSFDYEKQMSICIPTDIPLPNEKTFNNMVTSLLIKILELTKGKTFILFTSYGMLNYSHEVLSNHFKNSITLLKQGDINRHSIINKFKTGSNSVVLGTDSFWEGVDVAGNSLECVILIKLPFSVPSDPIHQGKVERIEQNGGNPFYDYSIPKSVIKFRQGFGRLIRTTKDKGIVICLDKRIITKSYGKIFLNSLPKCKVVIGDNFKLLKEIVKYF